MKKKMMGLLVLGLGFAMSACSQQTAGGDSASSGLAIPPMYQASVADQYRKLGNQGYELLDSGKTDEAIAAFTKQYELIPDGKWGAYNVACAYGRTGQVAQGLTWLGKAVDHGFDAPRQLQTDDDLASLRKDARFAAILDRSRKQLQRHEAAFAHGLPRYDKPPEVFADTDALGRWVDSVGQILNRNRSVWQDWQYTAAKMDVAAKRLAALRELKKDDPTFDYGLERVRSVARLRSVYDTWGPLAQAVQKEVKTYLATKPGTDAASEAHYRAGVAAYCEYHPQTAADSVWAASSQAARAEFAQVQPGTKFAGAADAWRLYFDLVDAGDSVETVFPRVRKFAETHSDDAPAMQIAGVFFQKNLVAALWPIPIDAVDIDNKPVSLDQYKGKVLLIDFWATWCGPCRAELPHVLAAYDKYHKEGFDILSISLDYGDRTPADKFRKWIAEKGMDRWRHIYNKKGWKGPLVEAYHVTSIPNPLLIGRDGSLAAMGDDCRGDNLTRSIEKALKKQGA